MVGDDNLWFRRKLYGWGWTPCSWQGWLSVLVYVVLMIFLFSRVSDSLPSRSFLVVQVILPFFIITVVLIVLCYGKGEHPCWQWGTPRKC